MRMKYTCPQVFLHWLSALVIIWATLSGFYVALFKVSPQIKSLIGFINVSTTTIFIPFFIARLYFMFRHGKPEESKPKTFSFYMAHFIHIMLYLSIAMVLVSGVLMMDRDINVFNLFYVPQPLHQVALTALFRQYHSFCCTMLAFLVFIHISAVFKHHLSGNKILSRMRF